MFRQSVRRFATTTARRAGATAAGNPVPAAAPSAYTLGISKAQGIAKGLTGGTCSAPPPSFPLLASFPQSFPPEPFDLD